MPADENTHVRACVLAHVRHSRSGTSNVTFTVVPETLSHTNGRRSPQLLPSRMQGKPDGDLPLSLARHNVITTITIEHHHSLITYLPTYLYEQ